MARIPEPKPKKSPAVGKVKAGVRAAPAKGAKNSVSLRAGILKKAWRKK